MVLAILAPYLVTFWLAEEWNDLAAAVAAVMVSLIHMVKVSIGLRQIEHFQQFTVGCLDTLKKLGYGKFPGKIEKEIPFKILIIEDLVDNSFAGGDLKARIHFLNGGFKFRAAFGSKLIMGRTKKVKVTPSSHSSLMLVELKKWSKGFRFNFNE